MKISRVATAVLIAAISLTIVRAQDAPAGAESARDESQRALAAYIAATAEERRAIRPKLLALGTDGLRKAMTGLAFEKPATTGIARFMSLCPDGHERPYWVYVPEKYDPAKSYPLVVNLHGGVSGMPLETEEFAPGLYALNAVLENLPDEWKENVILLGCSAGVPQTTEDARWWRHGGQNNILHMVREVRRAFNVDDDRIFVGGHSDGGSGAFALAQRRPDTFAGFFSLCGHPLVGFGDGVNVWMENLKGSRVYAVNGARDMLYPSAQMKLLLDQFRAAGAPVDTMFFENLTHDITPVVGPQVQQIMNDRVHRQRRDRAPLQIDWTSDTPATGRRAWLAIDEVLALGNANSLGPNAAFKLPAPRVLLGIRVYRDREAPTIESVDDGTTAEALGLKKDDVLLKIDDTGVETLAELQSALGAKKWGEEVKVTVRRGGKEETFAGRFPEFKETRPEFGPAARVNATLTPGKVTLKVRDAGRVSVYVTPSMLLDGRLAVALAAKDGSEIVVRRPAPLAADAELVLDQFVSTFDRKDATIARIEIDVARALGVERK